MASVRVFAILFFVTSGAAQSTPNFQEMFQNMMNALSSMAPPLEYEYKEEEEEEEGEDYGSWFYSEGKENTIESDDFLSEEFGRNEYPKGEKLHPKSTIQASK